MCRIDLKPSPACSPFNSEQDSVLLLYPQHVAYVVNSIPSLAVVGVTVKIQIGPMTMTGQGMRKTWFGDVFRDNEPQILIQHLRKPH